MPKNRYVLAVIGGLMGFVLTGLAGVYVRTLTGSRDLLYASFAGGIATFATLVSIDILTEWVERRNRRTTS